MKRFFLIIYSGIAWFLFACVFVWWTLVLSIVGRFTTGKPFFRIGKLLCRSLLFFSGIHVKTIDYDAIDPNKQYLVMANHINLFDPFVFNGFFPGHLIAFQEESHFRWPLYGWIMRKSGHIPICRKNPRKALEDLKRGPEVLKEKKDFSLIIFPEGTRSASGKLGVFKKGAFYLALDAGVEILPLIQRGGYERKKRKEWIINPGKMDVIAEKPISIEGYDRKNVKELIEKTRQVFLKYVDE